MDLMRRIVAACLLSLAFVLSFAVEVHADDHLLVATIKALETRLGGRVGAYVEDTATGTVWVHRADERFPLTSTFKTLACAALLTRVEQGEERLDRIMPFLEADLVAHSPISKTRVAAGSMELGEACEATMTVSDNTAANMVLMALGGPSGVTAYARSIGDDTTRLDRWETALNEGRPGDPRDTTTPRAMAENMRRLVLGDALPMAARTQLTTWLIGNKVGDAVLRAGVPRDWRVADRTGAGGFGSRAIAAVMWPPARLPVLATVYVTETEASFADRNAAIAEIGSAIANAVIVRRAEGP